MISTEIEQCKREIEALQEELQKLCSDTEDCKTAIKILREKLHKLQSSSYEVGNKFRHRVDKNVRMIVEVNGKKYFITVENDLCKWDDVSYYKLGLGSEFENFCESGALMDEWIAV